MKQSLENAMHEAMLHSAQNPKVEVMVFDKPHKKPFFTASPWMQKEKEQEGWTKIASFIGGKQK